MTRAARTLAALVMLAVAGGCGYALAGHLDTLPANIRTIGIPQVVNKSNQPDLDRILTQAVREEFANHRKYKIVPDAQGADAMLTVTITAVVSRPISFQNGQANRIEVTVSADVEFRDVSTGKVLVGGPYSESEQYDVTSGTSTSDTTAYLTGNDSAKERLSKALARRVVQASLEAG